MSDKSVARRYAQALFELGQEKDLLEEIQKDLKLVINVIAENEELKKVVEHQLIMAEDKQEIFKEIFADKVNPITLNFLLLVIQKRREFYLQSMYEQFLEYLDEFRGIEEARVKSAVQLSDDIRKSLEKQLEKVTGKKIRLKTEVDPEILGGLTVRIGDKVIDGSIKTRLNLLQKHLRQTELAK
ncbi:MAG: F-type H+-transporting ATPase subunit delta [Clostridia bacterium]|jgi:F-type H+-transporting ATPase subunit delta|nr:synthase delta subunit [Clostridiales bacterium]MDK2985068.1 F-type H+-transporting ATPase subunit delta [Clostridia bacterium]